MPDVLILVSTLGGLGMFGAAGIIVGPMVAAIFLTAWSVYNATFGSMLDQDVLDDVGEGKAPQEMDGEPEPEPGHDVDPGTD